ncbi:MAG TPA: TIGR04211 family SH3 domain-containing protein [Desulfobacteraceae bacterium]|nr:TIGR04211 family SH3 domain-containing protein [Desulfobacteraceae bacterium]
MRKLFTGIMAATLIFSFAASVAQARTAYVSDMLILTFREGPGTNYQVLQTLKSNTPLTILEEQNGFYKVALSSGEQGWVDKQIVVFDEPKTQVIDQLNREKAELEDRIEALMEQSETLTARLSNQQTDAEGQTQELSRSLSDLKTENKRLAAELAAAKEAHKRLKEASANVVATMDANKTLTEENQRLSAEISRLETETSHLFRTGMIKWFLAGVGVLLLGWIIGQSVSSKRRRGSSLLD